MALDVIREAFIEKADVHREQVIEAFERCRLIGLIPCDGIVGQYRTQYEIYLTKTI